MQWQVQLLANYSGHIFVPRDLDNSPESLTHSLIDSSLEILALRAEFLDLKSRNSALISKNKRLEAEAKDLRDSLHRNLATSHTRFRPLKDGQKSFSDSTKGTISPRALSKRKETTSPTALHTYRYNHKSSSPSSSGASKEINTNTQSPTSLQSDGDNQDLLALRVQQQYDEEDRHLRAQREQLLQIELRVFKCGVCLEEQPEDFVARLEPCGHRFCRDCIKGHVQSKLEEHRFPVICPSCMASQTGEPGGQPLLARSWHAHTYTSLQSSRIVSPSKSA